MSTVQYKNVYDDVIALLRDFFSDLQLKTLNKTGTEIITKASVAIRDFPNVPKENVYVSFDYEHNNYYIEFSENKIELTNYVEDWLEDENGKKHDFSSTQEYNFSFEIEGYSDSQGNIDQFSIKLLDALKNVEVSEINISDEE